MTYVLDTDAVVAILRDRPAGVRKKLRAALARKGQLSISAISLFELWHGVHKSRDREDNAQRVRIFLSGAVQVLDFNSDDAALAGALRATLESNGNVIGAYDLLIAAQALRTKATVVTANTREFRRVPRLKVQDWSRGRAQR